jgi:autotransporter-associated beta strand protein
MTIPSVKSAHVMALATMFSAAPVLLAADPAFTFTAFGQPAGENFNSYRGTEATIPSDIFVGWDQRIPDPFQGVNTGAFTAYTSDDEDYSFGIRERSPVDLRNGRVFLPVKNSTGQPIRYFEVSYDVEAWFIGNRRNRLRLKFDRFLTPSEAGGRETFTEDVFSTDNPSAETTPNTEVNGSLPENRITVSGIVDLENYSDGAGGFMGAIGPDETAWFRWQVSNASGDAGNLRSGLAVNNVVITPLESFTELDWKAGVGGDGVWQTAGGTDWNDGEWLQGAAAVFNAPAGVVTLDGGIEAFSVLMNSGYSLDAEPGATLFMDTGITVQTGVTATLNAPIREDGQLRKVGKGTLIIGGTQDHAGDTLIAGGTIRAGEDDILSPNAPVVISPGAALDLAGTKQTAGALIGERGGLVQLGTGGTLVIDTTSGGGAYRADLEGAGNVIIRGPGAQRFRSEKKTYTGFTRIEEGVLEVTGNGEMTGTSFIDVMPGGELFLVGDSSSGPPSGFGGPVHLRGGQLAMQDINDEALYFADFTLDVQEAGSTINVGGSQSFFIMDAFFDGVLDGNAMVRKDGAGSMELGGSHPHTGGMEIRNGSVLLESGASLGPGPLLFPSAYNTRAFILEATAHTVTKLDGDAPNQNDPEAANTLILNISGEDAVFTVNQALELDEEDNEVTTRFQGEIAGDGHFVKTGDGYLALTRWPKTYTGATTIGQGVLAVSQSATPAATSGVTVNPGGQLRLTSAGPDVSYTFGGPLTLAGHGRGGDATEGAGMGVLGALRYEPPTTNGGSTATLTNGIVFDAGDGVRLHVATAGNTLAIAGKLSGSGNGPILKSGGGTLRIDAPNSGPSLPWHIENGTLEVASGASSGTGTVTIASGAAVAGTGTVGGPLALLEGGRLTAAPGAQALTVNSAFSADAGSQVSLTGTLSGGTFTILTASGGITGADNLDITGLEGTGFSGTLEVAGNDLVLELVQDGGITYAAWANGVGPEVDVNGNGYPALMEFALGAASPGESFPRPIQGTVVVNDVEYLTLTATVRTNAPNLVVVGETSTDLGQEDPWDSHNVDHVTTGNPDVPAATEERVYRTPMYGAARFLRLSASQNPAF